MTGAVSPAARQVAAKVSRAFEEDQLLASRLNDAHGRLLAANDRLWSGLRPDGLAAIYGEHPQFQAVQLEESVHSGSDVLGSTDPLGALQDVHWQIHEAHHAYQTAAEDRRQLAAEIGELLARLVDELQGAGWTEDEARNANVDELARQEASMTPRGHPPLAAGPAGHDAWLQEPS